MNKVRIHLKTAKADSEISVVADIKEATSEMSVASSVVQCL